MSDDRPDAATTEEDAVTPSRAPTPTLSRRSPDSDPGPHVPGALVGQVLRGEFRLIRLLGTGGFGEVYLAEQLGGTRVLRQSVVKVLRAEGARSRQSVEQFRAEAEKMARASHPNIATMYSFWEEPDGRLVLAMEHAGQRDLATELGRLGRMGVERALELVRQASEGLHAAHRRGVVHRDIKPANLMLSDEDGREVVKVIDFGVARLRRTDADATVASVSGRGFFTGTPAYASPEQAEDHDLDARSDVYSLGVVLYELLTGDLPFPRTLTPHQMLFAHFSKPPRRPHELGVTLPDDVQAILDRALAKKPDDRFPSARELADALAARLGRPGTTPPPPRHEPPPAVERPAARTLPIAATAALVVALAVVALWPAKKPADAATPEAAPVAATAAKPSMRLVIRSLDASLRSTETPPTDDGHAIDAPLAPDAPHRTTLTLGDSGITTSLETRLDGDRTLLTLATEPPTPIRIDDILHGARASLPLGAKPKLVAIRPPDSDRPLRLAISALPFEN